MNLRLITALMLSLFFTTTSFAQKDKKERKSPAAEVMEKVGDAKVTINYSQPSVKGREIFGDLVPYGKVWRTGANEATTLTVSKEVTIGGKKLAAGTYALFTIPGEKEWTLILNSESKQWGSYKHDKDKDVLRVTVKPQGHDKTEKLTFSIDASSGRVHMDWAETRVSFTIVS